MNREAERQRLVALLRECEDKVQKTLKDKFSLDLTEWLGIYADHLLDRSIGVRPPKELLQNMGGYIYIIDEGDVIETTLFMVGYDEEGNDIVVSMAEGERYTNCFTDFGKTVFLTREEAEAKLGGKEDV